MAAALTMTSAAASFSNGRIDDALLALFAFGTLTMAFASTAIFYKRRAAFLAEPESTRKTPQEGVKIGVPLDHVLASVVRSAATEGQSALNKIRKNVDRAFSPSSSPLPLWWLDLCSERKERILPLNSQRKTNRRPWPRVRCAWDSRTARYNKRVTWAARNTLYQWANAHFVPPQD